MNDLPWLDEAAPIEAEALDKMDSIRTLPVGHLAATLALTRDLQQASLDRRKATVKRNVEAVLRAYDPIPVGVVAGGTHSKWMREQKRNARLNFAKQREKEKIAKAHASE